MVHQVALSNHLSLKKATFEDANRAPGSDRWKMTPCTCCSSTARRPGAWRLGRLLERARPRWRGRRALCLFEAQQGDGGVIFPFFQGAVGAEFSFGPMERKRKPNSFWGVLNPILRQAHRPQILRQSGWIARKTYLDKLPTNWSQANLVIHGAVV